MRGVLALIGIKPMSFRRELIYYYHSGLMDKHFGKDQTRDNLAKDWYRRQLASDVE